ncbi:MAG: hypothetical protein PHP37_02525 [Patescibacteria group bacterium]|nr:hypothetical protein [Patescibacteria group bacterium]
MKLKVNKNQINNYRVFLRRLGYALIFDRRRGVESFVRRLGDGYYPRIHLYVDDFPDYIVLNLHLDQKRASYQGFKMHNAEYDNEIINNEINRIKASFLPISDDGNLSDHSDFMEGLDKLLKE